MRTNKSFSITYFDAATSKDVGCVEHINLTGEIFDTDTWARANMPEDVVELTLTTEILWDAQHMDDPEADRTPMNSNYRRGFFNDVLRTQLRNKSDTYARKFRKEICEATGVDESTFDCWLARTKEPSPEHGEIIWRVVRHRQRQAHLRSRERWKNRSMRKKSERPDLGKRRFRQVNRRKRSRVAYAIGVVLPWIAIGGIIYAIVAAIR